jgi:hypothetical protein
MGCRAVINIMKISHLRYKKIRAKSKDIDGKTQEEEMSIQKGKK